MNQALRLAEKAALQDEVPVGAVVVLNNRIVGRGYNLTRTDKDPTAHAEMVALRKAAKKFNNERLVGSTLYVTLEPCAMCAGALIQARVQTLVFGTKDPKAGACGSALRVIPHQKLNHRPVVVKGVMALEAGSLLTNFFRKKRRKKVL